MADKPILFNGEMIRAILEGRKTQTRRILKPQPDQFYPHSVIVDKTRITENSPVAMFRNVHTGLRQDIMLQHAIGDRLWCRETWRSWNDSDFGNCGHEDHCNCPNEPPTQVCYRADGQEIDEEDREEYGIKWQPSIFMFRRFSRITLIVSDVRVQRLQDISPEDAKCEGVESSLVNSDRLGPLGSYRDNFRLLWNSINAKPSPKNSDGEIHHYESFPWGGESRVEEYRGKPHIITPNPWVTATTFNPLFQNIDSIGERP